MQGNLDEVVTCPVDEAQHTYLCFLRLQGRDGPGVGGGSEQQQKLLSRAAGGRVEKPLESLRWASFCLLPYAHLLHLDPRKVPPAFSLCAQGFSHLSQDMVLAILGSFCIA